MSEQGLAASLGVSRGPLREAIRRLEGRKLLERTPNIGVRVAALSPQGPERDAAGARGAGGHGLQRLRRTNMTDDRDCRARKAAREPRQAEERARRDGLLPGIEGLRLPFPHRHRQRQRAPDADADRRPLLSAARLSLQVRAPSPAGRQRRCEEHRAIVAALRSATTPRPPNARCASTCATPGASVEEQLRAEGSAVRGTRRPPRKAARAFAGWSRPQDRLLRRPDHFQDRSLPHAMSPAVRWRLNQVPHDGRKRCAALNHCPEPQSIPVKSRHATKLGMAHFAPC